nr:hypothetical protein CFP56_74845 [Quercus suber]
MNQPSIELTPTSEDHRKPVEVGDDNEVENAQSAIGNTPPATGEHIELERYLSAHGEIGDDIETDDDQNGGK